MTDPSPSSALPPELIAEVEGALCDGSLDCTCEKRTVALLATIVPAIRKLVLEEVGVSDVLPQQMESANQESGGPAMTLPPEKLAEIEARASHIRGTLPPPPLEVDEAWIETFTGDVIDLCAQLRATQAELEAATQRIAVLEGFTLRVVREERDRLLLQCSAATQENERLREAARNVLTTTGAFDTEEQTFAVPIWVLDRLWAALASPAPEPRPFNFVNTDGDQTS